MAKPGGKGGGKRKDKRADQEKDEKRAKPGKAPKSGRPAKPKRPKGAQRLVEKVAEEIVLAEFDRAVNGAAMSESAKREQEPAVQEGPAKRESAKQGAGSRKVAVQEVAAPETVAGEVAEAAADEPVVGDSGELLRLSVGAVDLAAIDTAATPGVSSREGAEAQLPKLAARLGELQERLFAAARGGDSNRRVLLVLQGMDTSGKGGTVRHVVGQFDPNGIRVAAFKAPTEEERAHDFLWRIRNALPKSGEVGIFDRSHYEDVLIARVHKLALPMVIGKRYQLINRFEQSLVADGTVIVKCFLHISPDEQRRRLLARLDDPTKHWKYSPTDVDERALWPEYQEAYRLALERCSTDDAPWYVIPADRKWYRNYAITRLLVEALERIDPAYPPGAFDVEVERKRLLAV